MSIDFINKYHKERYERILKDSKNLDNELIPIFYIISGCEGLYSKIDSIYDKEKRKLKIFKYSAWSSSEQALIKLALQLYNSSNNKQNVVDTFSRLDVNNFKLALNAIKISFRM